MSNNISAGALTKIQLIRAGSGFEEAGDIASAEESFEKAYLIDQKDKDIIIKLTRVLVSAKKLRRAEAIAEQHFHDADPDVRVAQIYIMMDINSYTIDKCISTVREKLSKHPKSAPILARAAMAMIWSGEIEEASICTKAAILNAPNSQWADAIRLLLARRAYNFGHHEVSNWICRIDRVGKGKDDEILYNRLQVRTGNAANDTTTHRLFKQLLQRRDFYKRDELTALHVDFLWRFEGPSDKLLHLVEAYTIDSQVVDNSTLLIMEISLAMQLGQEDHALTLLKKHPSLAKKYASCLPIAKIAYKYDLLDSVGVHPQLASYASLYDTLINSEAVLRQRLGSVASSIAVIGNSACEKGLGKGAHIDCYNEVVRFNRFQTAPPFGEDYGTKLTTHVRLGQDNEGFNIELAKGTLVVISSASTLFRGRAWRAAKRLHEQGQLLAVIPQSIHTKLSKLVGGSPSSGLTFAYLLKEIRGSLNRNDFFGFSFVDQIGPCATSAHYFEAAKPSSNHRWQNEREVFDGLFGEKA